MNFSDETNLRISQIDCAVAVSDEFGDASPVVHLIRISQKRSVDHDGAHVIIDDGGSPTSLPQAKKSFQPIHLIANRDLIDLELLEIKNPSTVNEGSDNLKKSIELHKRRNCNSTDNIAPDLNIQAQRKSIREANDLAVLTQKIIDQEKEIKDLKFQVDEGRKEVDRVIQMTANVAHDLKSPLNTLMLGLELIRADSNVSAQNDETLDCLESACAFMLGAIERSINFSKSSQGIGLSPHNACFDILSALNNPIKWIKTVLPADGRKCILLDPLPEGLSAIITDKLWFQENLFCLLSNADKYSSKGTIRVTLSIENKNIRVSVEDSGIGISSEFKEQLFKQFSKAQKMASGSTGLGLFSLLKRSEAIGGLCGFQNRGDGAQGSVFWFEFPHQGCSETLDLIPTKSNSEQKSLFILVVDDSAVLTKCLMNKLSNSGHRVETACNGADALEKMIEFAGQLDVVFMDMEMPVMDGLEATRRYREFEEKNGALTRLPIICSSANSDDGSAACAAAAGMDSILTKPFSADKLTLALAAIGANGRC